MRQQYHDDLDTVTARLVSMAHLSGEMIRKATQALLERDLQLAESVIALDTDMDVLNDEVERRTFDIMALQAPVAADLRLCVAALRMCQTLERMGDLASHIAITARRSYPESAIPTTLTDTFAAMGGLAVGMVEKLEAVVAGRQMSLVMEIEADDDRMDDLHREMFAILLNPDWSDGVDTAVNVTLLSRFYERFADHAVSVSRRMVFLVTGERDLDEVL